MLETNFCSSILQKIMAHYWSLLTTIEGFSIEPGPFPPSHAINGLVGDKLKNSNFKGAHAYKRFFSQLKKICLCQLFFIFLVQNLENKCVEKNPAYGRQRIFRPMRIVGPIQFWRGCMIYLEKKKINK